MSTLRITNIEAKADPSSPTVDEKIKLTNSNGDILVHIDGKTSGITTIGINTTAGNIKFDQNSNVVVTGIITATKFVGTIEPTTLTVGGDLTIPDKIVHTGDTNTAIRFPAADTFTVETAGSERLRIDNVGTLLVAHTTSRNNFFGATSTEHSPTIQMEGVSQNKILSLTSTNTSDGGTLILARQNGNPGTNTVVSSGNQIGRIDFQGNDGTNMETAAIISAEIDGTPGDNDMPGRLIFKTTADGASSPTERMRIDRQGRIAINDTTPDARLDIGGDDADIKLGGSQYFRIKALSTGELTFNDNDLNERLRIDSSGRILVGGTSARTNFNNGSASPQMQLENVANGNKSSIALIHNENATSDSSAINFGKTRGGSVGDNSALNQAGDRLGSITFQGNDGTEFVQAASIEGFTDATPGNNDMPGRLVFSTTADGGSSPQERMRIDKDGKLFVKNSFSDSARNVVIQIECSGQGRGRILSGNSDTDPATLGASSDRRLKTNIRNYTGGLERIRQIPVKIYDEVNTSATDVISWVADEVAPIFPEAVIGEANAVDADGNPEYQILSSLKFFPDLVQCVQTLIAKVETLETQNADLLARVTTLEG